MGERDDYLRRLFSVNDKDNFLQRMEIKLDKLPPAPKSPVESLAPEVVEQPQYNSNLLDELDSGFFERTVSGVDIYKINDHINPNPENTNYTLRYGTLDFTGTFLEKYRHLAVKAPYNYDINFSSNTLINLTSVHLPRMIFGLKSIDPTYYQTRTKAKVKYLNQKDLIQYDFSEEKRMHDFRRDITASGSLDYAEMSVGYKDEIIKPFTFKMEARSRPIGRVYMTLMLPIMTEWTEDTAQWLMQHHREYDATRIKACAASSIKDAIEFVADRYR